MKKFLIFLLLCINIQIYATIYIPDTIVVSEDGVPSGLSATKAGLLCTITEDEFLYMDSGFNNRFAIALLTYQSSYFTMHLEGCGHLSGGTCTCNAPEFEIYMVFSSGAWFYTRPCKANGAFFNYTPNGSPNNKRRFFYGFSSLVDISFYICTEDELADGCLYFMGTPTSSIFSVTINMGSYTYMGDPSKSQPIQSVSGTLMQSTVDSVTGTVDLTYRILNGEGYGVICGDRSNMSAEPLCKFVDANGNDLEGVDISSKDLDNYNYLATLNLDFINSNEYIRNYEISFITTASLTLHTKNNFNLIHTNNIDKIPYYLKFGDDSDINTSRVFSVTALKTPSSFEYDLYLKGDNVDIKSLSSGYYSDIIYIDISVD